MQLVDVESSNNTTGIGISGKRNAGRRRPRIDRKGTGKAIKHSTCALHAECHTLEGPTMGLKMGHLYPEVLP